MEQKISYIEPLFERAEEYGKTSYHLLKLKAIDKTTELASTVISRGIALCCLVFFVIVLSIGASLWLGELLGKSYYGFFCVAGFYALTYLILYYFLHDWIKEKISNSMIVKLLN